MSTTNEIIKIRAEINDSLKKLMKPRAGYLKTKTKQIARLIEMRVEVTVATTEIQMIRKCYKKLHADKFLRAYNCLMTESGRNINLEQLTTII